MSERTVGDYALAAVILLHAAVHLVGFAKAFGLADVAALHHPISRGLGLLWLAAALLLATTAFLVLASFESWWIVGATAVVVSEIAIVTAWQDAKFGTVPNLLLFLPLVVAALNASPGSFRSRFRDDVQRGFQAHSTTPVLVSEADLAGLPAPVSAYLRYAGVVGKPRVQNFRVAFRGQIRPKPDANWMSFRATQQSFIAPATRLFLLESSLFGIPFVALHRYVGSRATMQVKVASLLTVVDAKGPEMNQSETVTFFNDLCLMAPAALIDPHIRWETLTPRTVRATFTHAESTVTADLFFDEEGKLVDFQSDDRYQSADGKTYVRYRWSTPVHAYANFDGHRLTARADAAWAMPPGELVYGHFELVSIEYNVSRP